MAEQLAHHRQGRRVHLGEATDGFERLDEDTCWALLAGVPVGRVGVVVAGSAEIYPVNYIVDRQPDGTPAIVFRTDPGTKLAGLAGTPHISFEVDDLDLDEHTGWSVVVKGRARQARELADPDERHRVQRLTVASWDATPKRHWIRLEPIEVTGRRLGPPPAPAVRTQRHRLSVLPTVAEWTGREVWLPPRSRSPTTSSRSGAPPAPPETGEDTVRKTFGGPKRACGDVPLMADPFRPVPADGDWHHNAILTWNMDDAAIAWGFSEAGRIIIDTWAAGGPNDALFLPVVYLYRHASSWC